MASILAYADRFSAKPGETVVIRASVEGADSFEMDLVRLICGDQNPNGPGFRYESIAEVVCASYRAEVQRIRVGSYAQVPIGHLFDLGRSFTASILCRPTFLGGGRQCLMSCSNDVVGGGWSLGLDEAARPFFRIGDNEDNTQEVVFDEPVTENWCQLIVVVDDAKKQISLHRIPIKGRAIADLRAGLRIKSEKLVVCPPAFSPSWLTIAAEGCDERVAGSAPTPEYFFTGRLEKPRLLACALSDGELAALQLREPPERNNSAIVGWWNFEDDLSSSRIVDRSLRRHNGKLFNTPARAVAGAFWNGTVYDWKSDPAQYGAIHFHADDLTDARWKPSASIALPKSARSGVYAARISAGDAVEYIPFVVRAGDDQKRCPLAVLLPTASYLAYSNWVNDAFAPATELVIGHTVILGRHELQIANHTGLGLSLYERHIDGSGAMYASRHRPILNMRPDYISSHGTFGSPVWQFSADLHIIDWLEAKGFAYDVITDEDLHVEGIKALADYRCIITGSHPEYHSNEQLNAIECFTKTGGRLFYAGGNGFYWRVAYDPEDSGIIELRRAGGGWRSWANEAGEYYDAFSGGYGGTWENIGRSTSSLMGLSFSAAGMGKSTYYTRMKDSFDARAAFIFEGIAADEKLGDFGLKGGGAVGIEFDRYDAASAAPEHILVLAEAQEIPNTYTASPDTFVGTVRNTTADMSPNVAANIVFFETEGGGAVFSTGSIAWAGSLYENNYINNISRISENVIRRFVDDEPFRFNPQDAGFGV